LRALDRSAKLALGQFAPWAFEVLRYRADGSENPDFILNQGPFRHAKILVAGANFGCGSSREMAVWSIQEFGIGCIVAQGYGDIFYGNCLQNCVLPVTLPRAQVEALAVASGARAAVTVDVAAGTISSAGLAVIAFDFPAAQRAALLSGRDEVDQTVAMAALIAPFQQDDRNWRPWAWTAARPRTLNARSDRRILAECRAAFQAPGQGGQCGMSSGGQQVRQHRLGELPDHRRRDRGLAAPAGKGGGAARHFQLERAKRRLRLRRHPRDPGLVLRLVRAQVAFVHDLRALLTGRQRQTDRAHIMLQFEPVGRPLR
jgi:3-isopropylmalate/(R)-2-methylmalate dehydratase small subunit